MTQSLCYTGCGTSVAFTDMISIRKLSAWLLSEIMSEFCLAYFSSDFAWNSDKFFFILPGIVTLLTVGDGDRILFIFSYKQSCLIYSAILTSRELMHKVLFEKFRGSICDEIDFSLSLSHILPSPIRLLLKSPLCKISVKFCSFSTIFVMLSRVWLVRVTMLESYILEVLGHAPFARFILIESFWVSRKASRATSVM